MCLWWLIRNSSEFGDFPEFEFQLLTNCVYLSKSIPQPLSLSLLICELGTLIYRLKLSLLIYMETLCTVSECYKWVIRMLQVSYQNVTRWVTIIETRLCFCKSSNPAFMAIFSEPVLILKQCGRYVVEFTCLAISMMLSSIYHMMYV